MKVEIDVLEKKVRHVDFSDLAERKGVIVLGKRDKCEAKVLDAAVSVPSAASVRVVGSAIRIEAYGPLPKDTIVDLEDAFYLFMNGYDEDFTRALSNLMKKCEIVSLDLIVAVKPSEL